jgi:hypothetical protein
MVKISLPATVSCTAAGRLPLSYGPTGVAMPESSKPAAAPADSEKERLRQKLLRLIVKSETRRRAGSPPPRIKR